MKTKEVKRVISEAVKVPEAKSELFNLVKRDKKKCGSIDQTCQTIG